MTNSEVAQQVLNGYRLEKPRNATDELYEKVMLRCWAQNPLDRPSFEVIFTLLDEMLSVYITPTAPTTIPTDAIPNVEPYNNVFSDQPAEALYASNESNGYTTTAVYK